MALPKRRTSKYRQGKRRAVQKIELPNLVKCSNPACNSQVLMHQACPECGFYKGKPTNRPKNKKITA